MPLQLRCNSAAGAAGDRIAVMHQGRVRQVDTPARVYERPADTFVAGFLGNPPMNLITKILGKDGDRVTVRPDAAPQVTICAPSLNVLERVPESGAVVLGVRPEHLRTSPATGALPDSDGFDVIVELAEALGHEQLLHLRVDGIPLTVRGAPGIRPAVGSSVRVHVDPSHVHLFDAATGVLLR